MNPAGYASIAAEINRLIQCYDALPKDVQLEVLMFLKSYSSGVNLNPKYLKKKIATAAPIGSINVFIE